MRLFDTTVLALLLACVTCVACAHVANADRKIQVQLLDSSAGADTHAFDSPAYETHPAPASPTALTSPRTRDAAFSRAGLEPELQGWGSVDRDVLYLRARSLSQAELRKHYPKLSPDSLRKLIEALPTS